jgi:hypothetical protein
MPRTGRRTCEWTLLGLEVVTHPPHRPGASVAAFETRIVTYPALINHRLRGATAA